MGSREALIRELVEDLKPFTPLRPPLQTALAWALSALATTSIFTFLLEPYRSGVWGQFASSPRLLLEAVLAFSIVFFSSWTVLLLGIPGRKTKNILRLTISACLGFTALFAYSFFEPSTTVSMSGKRPHCVFEGLVYGTLLVLSLLLISKKRAPLARVQLGLFGGLAAGTLTMLVMHAACMYDPWHIFMHHVLPVVPLAVIGACAAPLLIQRL